MFADVTLSSSFLPRLSVKFISSFLTVFHIINRTPCNTSLFAVNLSLAIEDLVNIEMAVALAATACMAVALAATACMAVALAATAMIVLHDFSAELFILKWVAKPKPTA